MLLQSLVNDKEKSTGSARGIAPQDILSSLSRKDKKRRLELLDDGESEDEYDDLYQPFNLSNEIEYHENIDYEDTIFPMWDPHGISLANTNNGEENNIEENANIYLDDRRMETLDIEHSNYSDEEDIDFQHSYPSKAPVEQTNFNDVPDNSTKIRSNNSSKNRPKLLKLMKSPCNCKQNCLTNIPEERRVNIYAQYWTKCYEKRSSWLKSYIEFLPVKRRRSRKNSGLEKQSSFKYHLPNDKGLREKVCRTFFLKLSWNK